MRIDIAAQTDVGRHKRNNEDFFGVFREDTPDLQLFQEGALLCVADGLGGHIGGEIASKLAVSVLKDTLKQPPPDVPEEDPEARDQALLKVLSDGITRANENIYRTNRELVKNSRPMGTTLLAVLVDRRKARIANVGDSRCYHLREGEIINKTEDHSWVDEQVKLGLMSKAEAESDLRRNLVTRCIGTNPEVPIDTYVWHVVPGDILLLCTDGLVNMVKDGAIRDVFRKRGASAEIAHRLVDLANEKGGRDNTTVIVAHISPTAGHFIAGFLRRRRRPILWALLALLFGAACFAAGYFVRLLFF
jgi:protein phosphatase